MDLLLLEKMEQLLRDNVHFSQKVALLSMQLTQLKAGQLHRKCPVALLDKFDGSLAQFPTFFGQCQLCMNLWAEDFSTDRDKMGFLISLLIRSAVHWATPLLT